MSKQRSQNRSVIEGEEQVVSASEAEVSPALPRAQESSEASRQAATQEESAWIAAAQRGEREAFEHLVRRYDRQVLRLALNLTGSETEARDLYQEAFLKAYRSLGNFRFECSFYTWMYRIVSNVCMDHLRRRQVRKEESVERVNDEGETVDLLEMTADERAGSRPDQQLLSKELGARIHRALAKLNGRERMVFELRHYEGMRLRAIGEALGTSEETAKNTLFRATQKLRQALAEWRQ